MTEAILSSLTWLGLDWDGDPIFQSQRKEVYSAAVDRLLAAGKAYWCGCSPEDVDKMREEATAKGLKPKYDGRCRDRGLGPGPGRVVRFKTPMTGRTVFDDIVKGPIGVDNAELDDMVIRRPDGWAVYNLAVVVDDNAMGITHVVRGDDHVSNTPKQQLLYEALGWSPPKFGHVPLIHGQDKKKLSKRHGARSVGEYKDEGFLPEALVNYLVRLGWSHGDEEIFSVADLIEKFDLSKLSRSAAAFDPEKLLWLNAHWIKEADPARLAELLRPFLAARGLTDVDGELLVAVIPQYQTRAKTLVEMAQGAAFFFTPDEALEYDGAATAKFLTPESKALLAELRSSFAEAADFSVSGIESLLTGFLDSKGVKFKVLAQPLRVALTGKTMSPGLYETISLLGKARTLSRLDRAATL